MGDSSSYQRAVKEAAVVTDKLGLDMKKLSVTAESSARAQVAASVRKTARLKNEIAVYRQVAAASEKGSREQIAATNLAARAERNLGGSLAATKTEARAFGGTAARTERDVGRMTRGALAGSGIFRTLGRSIAFAGGGFLAFAGAAGFLRASIVAARQDAVVQRQLAAQLAVSGKSFADYRGQIDKTILRLSDLSGFTKDDLTQAFTTILRTTGNVSKSLRDVRTAAALSRAKPNVGLAQAATILAKVEAGNTTLLRRQGFDIAKHISSVKALIEVRKVLAGQIQAGTTAEQRFSNILHNTEIIIGTALLPTLNHYLGSLGQWLTKMNESGRLQRDVNTTIRDGKKVVDAIGGAIHTADRITGSFKHTLELLLALKVASTLTKWTKALVGFEFAAGAGGAGGAAGRLGTMGAKLRELAQIGLLSIGFRFPRLAEGLSKVPLLRGQLTKLALIKAITIPIVIGITADWFGRKIGENLDFSPKKFLGDIKHPFRNWKGPLVNWILGNGWQNDVARAKKEAARKLRDALAGSLNATATNEQNPRINVPGSPTFIAPRTQSTTAPGSSLTATQRNTFFDNQVARILLRGGLGKISQQIGALTKADALITARIKVTKDVTRRLRLEDELLQNQAQIQSLRSQQAANALQARQQAAQEFLDALQFGVTKAQATASFRDDISALQALQNGIRKEISVQGKTLALQQQLFDVGEQIRQARKDQAQARVTALTGRQFRQLGLTSTGDELTPTKRNLRKRLGQLTANVRASDLDTPKLESELARFRKVLAEKLVPKDVRAKIREMMDQIAQELQNSGRKNQSKFKHLGNNVILAGLGLTPEQIRLLRSRLGQMSAGGVVPGAPSLAFSQAGPQTIVNTTVTLDGKVVAKNTTAHQQKDQRRRSVGRRGPYAGRH